MLAQRVGQRAGAPQKHPAVPEIIPRSHESGGLLRVGLFGESAHAQRVATEAAARLNVAVSGFRPIRPDAEHHNVFARSRDLHATFNRRAITFFIANHMVGRKHANHRIGMFAQQKKSGQPDRRRGIAPHRLSQHLILRQFRKLLQNRRTQITVGDDPESCFGEASGSSRATVCWIMVCLPSSASNCLARFFRLKGQKRVPRPPARITG